MVGPINIDTKKFGIKKLEEKELYDFIVIGKINNWEANETLKHSVKYCILSFPIFLISILFINLLKHIIPRVERNASHSPILNILYTLYLLNFPKI